MKRMVCAALLVALAGGCTTHAGDVAVLDGSWTAYRSQFITDEGRVVRPEDGNDTTSEAQASTLLRAAWMDDQATFDRVWLWSRRHLLMDDGPAPGLMAWHWSPKNGGRVVDAQPATDADADLALALIEAGGRWGYPADSRLPAYSNAARDVLDALLGHVYATDEDGTAVLLPGVWADDRAEGRGLVLNPSYLAPAWYRVFGTITGDPRWEQLVDGAYRVLGTVCGERSPLPPDWVRWWSDTHWTPEGTAARAGWDAVRVPWRVASDRAWFGDPRADVLLDRLTDTILRPYLDEERGLPIEWSLDGEPLDAADHPLSLALFALAPHDLDLRDRIMTRLDARLFVRGSGIYFGDADSNYVNSLAYLPYLVRAGRYRPPSPSLR